MHAASATAALPNDPDPSPDPVSGRASVPTRTGRVLGLLYKLIQYGKDLAHSLQQATASTAAASVVARHFGTLNIVLVLSRIARGLRLATALEARLVSHPLREEAAPTLVRARSERPPRTAIPAAQPASRAASQLPEVPTAEEIAAALRHRPIGEVIADICRDLGIVQSHPLWGDILMVVTEFGGNYMKLFKDTLARVCTWFADLSALGQDASPAPWPQAAAACSTGPP